MKKIKNNKRKNIIIRLLKKQNGSEIITTPIVIALGLLILSTLIVFSVKILMPYIWYEKLSSTCLKYIFVMEEYGYLTSKEKQSLTNELIKQGFNKENLKIYCTDKRQRYGNPIYLNVNYNYNLELPLIGTKNIPMNINRESVSKR
ncbi:MAG: hypothetical protein J6C46_12760 [Clostridia bacterium]|nr:hypothetical protein [Clostridia bacterium]